MARAALVIALGAALVVIGTILLVLPGPGIPLLILGLTLLASRVPWAKRALDRLRRGWRDQ